MKKSIIPTTDIVFSDFANVKCYRPFGQPIGSVSGDAIRITYPDGNVEIITDYGVATVTNGEVFINTITFDSDGFAELIKKYTCPKESL